MKKVKGCKRGYKVSEYWLICHHIKYNGCDKRMSANVTNRIKYRFHYECAICGLKDKECAELHHIIPLGMGGRNDIDNLVCLCANCHRKVHSPIMYMVA